MLKFNPWKPVTELPPNNVWVIGSCKLISNNSDVFKDYPEVIFQVKYNSVNGWSDWCGDMECLDGWKVMWWMEIPYNNP